ncbi:uracil-DNA glycosylase [Prosthecodimorpha staleyi]|uniref:Type-4 uracil-DNA glycosylase n=1 Tax=Prosthecodimorpha staleyi TaxID=2840188 RepID=A0A947GEG4_9HYPH|nr:uracil-DNA glycosylase [Prosthecodimorpha staleyi]MBT9291917.1 uracil-DNA glycosylase [Prosthecodimorpha staleyi]
MVDRAALAALIDWYVAAGVDVGLGEAPCDRFAETRAELEARRQRAAAPPPAAVPSRPAAAASNSGAPTADRYAPPAGGPPQGGRPPVPMPPERPRFDPPPQPVARPALGAGVPGDQTVAAAREAARAAGSLEDLREILARFEGCNLRLTAKSLVFADGNPAGRVMFVGEAPGREEDEAGLPFVGRSGQLLDRMMKAIGLDRTGVYIANVVPWRPPGNRTPTPQETEICRPFIARQIELADPDVLVFLGGASAAALAGTTEGITRLRGRWLDYDTGRRRIRALATLHPAYLLRQPLQKRLAWRDFLALRRALDDGVPT